MGISQVLKDAEAGKGPGHPERGPVTDQMFDSRLEELLKFEQIERKSGAGNSRDAVGSTDDTGGAQSFRDLVSQIES